MNLVNAVPAGPLQIGQLRYHIILYENAQQNVSF
jgi:hypothetical protein